MKPDTTRRTNRKRGAGSPRADLPRADPFRADRLARTDRSNGSRLARLTGNRDRLRTLVAAVAFVAAVALVMSVATAPATARFPIDNISNVDDTATVTPSGANVAVSGWIHCSAGEIAEVRVTASQGETVATGTTHVRCRGLEDPAFWTVHVSPRGPATYDASNPITVDAWAATHARGQQTDGPHTWSPAGPVTLVPR